MELLTHGGEHHEIGDGGRLMMMMVTDSILPEHRTDSRSALPRGFRAWRRLRIVKRDESFSLIFFLPEHEYMELEFGLPEVQGAQAHQACPGGWARPLSLWLLGGPPLVYFSANIFIYSTKILHKCSCQSKNFDFCTKTTPWQFWWKLRQSRLVSFRSWKLASKTRAKSLEK